MGGKFSESDRQTDRQTNRQTDRQADSQTDRQTGRQRDRQIVFPSVHLSKHLYICPQHRPFLIPRFQLAAISKRLELEGCAWSQFLNFVKTPGEAPSPVPPTPQKKPPKNRNKKKGVGHCCNCVFYCIDTLPVAPVGLVLGCRCP